jgi:hypothetical protein
VTLKGPGFLVPGDMVGEYASGSKAAYLQERLAEALQSAKVRNADLWKAK